MLAELNFLAGKREANRIEKVRGTEKGWIFPDNREGEKESKVQQGLETKKEQTLSAVGADNSESH